MLVGQGKWRMISGGNHLVFSVIVVADIKLVRPTLDIEQCLPSPHCSARSLGASSTVCKSRSVAVQIVAEA